MDIQARSRSLVGGRSFRAHRGLRVVILGWYKSKIMTAPANPEKRPEVAGKDEIILKRFRTAATKRRRRSS